MDDAARADPEFGIQERACFFGPRSAPLFGCLHVPVGGSEATIVMCPPIDADFTMNYRQQVLLARFLAAAGIAVQRFHYRGAGNSFGDPAEMTFETLHEDALLATELALSHAGSPTLAFLGGGWGALMAASSATGFPSAPLILWEPITEPARYYRGAFLAKMSRQTVHSVGAGAAKQDPLDELAANGFIDVLGFALHRRLYEASKGRTLLGELGESARSVLLVQPDEKEALRAEYRHVASALEERGFAVEIAAIGKPTAVWFHTRNDVEQTTREVATCIESWLAGAKTRE